MDDLVKQWEQFKRETEKVLRKLPVLIGNTAKNFFVDRFKSQDWVDTRTEPWKKRKANSPRNTGRAILTDTGRGKRAIRVLKANIGEVEVGIEGPEKKYMGAHNKGFRGTVQVGAHSRIATRKVGTRVLKLKGRQKRERIGGRKTKIRGASHQVKGFSRKMNLPKRQFIGNSHFLDRRIDRQIMSELLKL